MQRQQRSTRVVRGTLLAMLVGAVALPASAAAKSISAKATDVTGDATTPALDLVKVTARYTRTTGAIRVSTTVAAPLDLKRASTILITFSGKGCLRDAFGIAVDLDDALAPWAYTPGKRGVTVGGSGTVGRTRWTGRFKAKRLARRSPAYVQLSTYAPGAKNPTDQTDCLPLR